jgi:hypothetical protein
MARSPTPPPGKPGGLNWGSILANAIMIALGLLALAPLLAAFG